MAVRIRSATSSDVELVVSSRLAFLREVRGDDYRMPSGFEQKTRSFIVAESGAGRLHTWIAEEHGALVGIVSMLLWPRPPQPEDLRSTEAYIINMHVPPEHQRRGIGRSLLDCCIDSAEVFGIRKFLLHSTDQGRPLYDSVGFTPKANWLELPVDL